MFRTVIRYAAVALVLASVGTLSGCAGSGPPPPDTSSAIGAIEQTIFSVHCLSAGCHNGADRAGDVVLEAGQSYANLVNVPAFNSAARAAGLRRVVPNSPDQSFLLLKLTGPLTGGQGSRMPVGAAPLSVADIDLIRSWILAGAPGATPSPTNSASPTMTATASPTITPTPTVTLTGTRPPTPTPSETATRSPTPSVSPSASATATPSVISTPTFSMQSTLADIQTTIFDVNCSTLGCHNGVDLAGNLSLDPGSSYAGLVGVPPDNSAAFDGGFLRVDPGHPDNSFLLTKLTLPTAFDVLFGSRMPSGAPPLDANQIEQIRAWILRGALADEPVP